MLSFLKSLIILLLLLANSFWGNCNNSLIYIYDHTGRLKIGKDLYIYHDYTNSKDITAIQALDENFIKCKSQVPSFGATNDTYWFRFKVKNIAKENKWILHIGNPYLKEVSLYYFDKDKKINKIEAGKNQAFDLLKIPSRDILIPLQLNMGEQKTFYFRIRNDNMLQFPIEITTIESLYTGKQTTNLYYGILFGLLCSLFLYNLFVYFYIRDNSHIYYCVYILFNTLNLAFIGGFTFYSLPDNLEWLNSTVIFASGSVFFGTLFTNSFLRINKNDNLVFAYSIIILTLVIITLILAFAGFTFYAFKLNLLTDAILITYVFIAGVYRLKSGYTPAGFYLAGFGILVLSIIVFSLKDYGLIPFNTFTQYSLQLGSVIELIILSMALAHKMNYYKTKKDLLQKQALEESQGFSKKLIENQESERKRIASELHDSIGQTLALLKNKSLLLLKRNNESPEVNRQLTEMNKILEEGIQEVRTISYGLRPYQLDILGFTKAVESLCEDYEETSGINFDIKADKIDGVLDTSGELHLYRILQECFNNVVKHSKADTAFISITISIDSINILITDNGIGFDMDRKNRLEGFGLLGISERVNFLNASLRYSTIEPSGTKIEIVIPVKSN